MSEENGFLTETDKAFIRGEKEYSAKQSRYHRRDAIRKRTRRAFYDFSLLHVKHDDLERHKIFSPSDHEVSLLNEKMVDTIAFLYHALETGAGTDPTGRIQTFPYSFSQLLEEGVRRGEIARQKKLGNYPFSGNVDVTFEVEVNQLQHIDTRRVAEALAKNGGAELTDDELRGAIINAVNQTMETEIQRNIDGEAPERADEKPEVGLRRLAKLVEEEAKKLENERVGGDLGE